MMAVAVRSRRSGEVSATGNRPRLAHAVLFASVGLAVGGAWYLRSYLATGNPVFPFFKAVFGGSGLDVVLEPAKRPLPVTPVHLLTALVPMTLDPDRFDSHSHQFGPLFLMLLPGLFVLRPPRRLVVLVGLGFAFYIVCLTQRQSMRFLLAAVGPWAVGAGWVARRLVAQAGRRAQLAVVLVGLGLVGESALALARVRHALPVLLGRESAQEYLARREPTSVVGRWIDENLPRSARIIGQDHRGFYLPRAYTMELAHRRRTGLANRGEPPDQIAATLTERGFTHLLICPPQPEDAVEFDPTLTRTLAPWLEGQVPVYSAALTDGDGVRRAYALYELPRPIARASSGEARR